MLPTGSTHTLQIHSQTMHWEIHIIVFESYVMLAVTCARHRLSLVTRLQVIIEHGINSLKRTDHVSHCYIYLVQIHYWICTVFFS